jgi:thiosulfate/3-mercaptopyruvate sulfurtransferase
MPDAFVSPAWLDEHRDSVRVVDVRDAWEFDGIGHVPGAVNVPFDRFRADEHAVEGDSDSAPEEDADGAEDGDSGAEGMLPGEDVFAALAGEAGIDRDTPVVAYDDTHGVFAARFLVTAELYGHDPSLLHLLDGDYSAWTRSYPVTTESTTVAETTYDVARPARSSLVDREAVAAALADPDAVVVDTRERWEYEEGHLPGAVQLDWKAVVDEETRGLRDRAAVEALLADRGITPDRRVVLYCNTARRISHTYLVLRHLGYDDVGFYEGSLTEWSARGAELVTGPDPNPDAATDRDTQPGPDSDSDGA